MVKKSKKALVTGSAGFVGSHLVEALKKNGYQPIGFDLKNGQDILNTKQVEKYLKKVDVVFNLAGILGTHELIEADIRKAVQINVVGALNILNAAKKYQVDVVEICKPNLWLNTYSITKQAAEDFTIMYAKEFGLKTWAVRWYNVFGPRQHYGSPQKLAPTSIVKALRNEPIPVFGTGKQTADHIYAEDCAEATIAIYECYQVMGRAIEVGHHHMTINKFVEKVIRYTNSQSKIKHIPMRRGEDDFTIVKANTSLLKKVVRFKPKHTFKQGLLKTIEYYRKHLTEFEK